MSAKSEPGKDTFRESLEMKAKALATCEIHGVCSFKALDEGRRIDAVSAKPLSTKLCGVGNTVAFSLLPTPITSAT
jgi:hypothetical protein